MTEEPKLIFSANGTEVTLRTVHGNFNFSSEEYQYYHNLYRIIDCQNEGVISLHNLHLYLLLVRTGISSDILERALNVASSFNKDGNSATSLRFLFKTNYSNINTNAGTVVEESSDSDPSSPRHMPHSRNSAAAGLPRNNGSDNGHDNGRGKNQNKTKKKKQKENHSSVVVVDSASLSSSESQDPAGGDDKINFFLWLLLCKTIACYQETNRIPSEKFFKSLHSSNLQGNLVDFQLGRTKDDFPMGRFHMNFDVKITGFQLYGEEENKQHTKYRLTSNSSLVNETNLRFTDSSGSSKTVSDFTVERRYSEFESFSQILQSCYQGNIIPPLPSKIWTFNKNDEILSNQRSLQFQMFLDDLSSHPLLGKSFELKCFLTNSTNGFKSFLDLYHHFDSTSGKFLVSSPSSYSSPASSSPSNETSSHNSLSAHAMDGSNNHIHHSNNSSSGNSAMSRFINESSSLISNGAASLISSAKSIEFVSSLWGNISKTMNNFTNISNSNVNSYNHLLHNSSEDVQLFNRISRFLETVGLVGKSYEKLLALEESKTSELTKIGQCFKSTSESELQPDLVKILQISHSSIMMIGRNEQETATELSNKVSLPINYLGRYSDSYKIAFQNRQNLQESLIQSWKEEKEKKSRLEVLQASLNSNGNLNHAMIRSGYPDQLNEDVEKFKEEEVEVAKLSLNETEKIVSAKTLQEEQITTSLHNECIRLSARHQQSLLECLIALTKEKIKLSNQNVEYWTALKFSLDR